jgi:endonuclease YncB( thermonuclease family)
MRLILLLLLTFTLNAADLVADYANIYEIKKWRVIDGDTIEADLIAKCGVTLTAGIRIYGINTPEKKGSEKIAGIPVTNLTIQWMEDNSKDDRKMYCRIIKADKYGGRQVGSVFTDQFKKLADYQTKHGLCDPYDGKSKKAPFTAARLKQIQDTVKTLLRSKAIEL